MSAIAAEPEDRGAGARVADRLSETIDRLAPELIDAISTAIQVPSINPRYPGVDYEDHVGAEGVVSPQLAGHYERAGCEVDVFAVEPGRENAVGVLRGSGSGRSLLFNGHVDVVPAGPDEDWKIAPPWSGLVEDGRIWGRGATDMKAGLVCQAFAALALRESGIRLVGDLLLQAVVGEETMDHELGTSACVERGQRADAAIVAEASAPPAELAVVPVTPGATRFIVTVSGRRTHPGLRAATIWPGGGGEQLGVNAIDKAIHVYQALRLLEYEWAMHKRHPLFAPGQFGVQPGVFVGSPKGQLDPFFIPDHAWLDYVVIYPPDEQIEAVRAEVEEAIGRAAALDPWLRTHPPEVEWKQTTGRRRRSIPGTRSCSNCWPPVGR